MSCNCFKIIFKTSFAAKRKKIKWLLHIGASSKTNGDKSESFSYAITNALEIVLTNSQIVAKYKNLWESL